MLKGVYSWKLQEFNEIVNEASIQQENNVKIKVLFVDKIPNEVKHYLKDFAMFDKEVIITLELSDRRVVTAKLLVGRKHVEKYSKIHEILLEHAYSLENAKIICKI